MGKKMFKLFMETMLRAAVIILAVCIVIMLALLIKTVNKNKKNEKKTEETKKVTELSTEEIDPDDPTFNGNGGSGGSGSEDGSEANTSEDGSGDAEGTSSDIKSAKIAVINSTGTQGVAGTWKSVLEADGYTSVEVGNYITGVNSTTQICVSGTYDGSGLAEKFNSPTMGKISDLNAADYDVTLENYDIVIVVGTSDVQ
ncbi:MAG: LytR C-terminal domain-containing protein [Coprococcus sp.]|nr:LytR C-terminal domain-containing protein [Coprococcus sp.]